MKKTIIFLIIIFMLTITSYIWWKNGISSANKEDKTEKVFIIRKGEGVREIANSLKKEGLIKDPIVFFLLIKTMGLDGKIQAGDFRLSPSMTTKEIAINLTHGTLDVWITIPEGKRAEEINEILKAKIPTFNTSWRNELIKNEGYLFPDTYLIPKDADIDLISSLMRNNFEKKYSEIKNINNTNLSKKEIVIVASLVEREAKFPEDRSLVASVILNRLRLSMPLQIDATIQYILGYQLDQKSWWKKNLTKDDLVINSLYNTYLNVGLPPSPIANPGFNVLNAVANPAETKYLYYISDKSGHNHYAKTLGEHNKNIQKFGL